jgi:hypothetical protein
MGKITTLSDVSVAEFAGLVKHKYHVDIVLKQQLIVIHDINTLSLNLSGSLPGPSASTAGQTNSHTAKNTQTDKNPQTT